MGERQAARRATKEPAKAVPKTRRWLPPGKSGLAGTADWVRIAALYDGLSQVAPSTVVELNRAVAVGMACGPRAGLFLRAASLAGNEPERVLLADRAGPDRPGGARSGGAGRSPSAGW